jgi:hypothetical protein
VTLDVVRPPSAVPGAEQNAPNVPPAKKSRGLRRVQWLVAAIGVLATVATAAVAVERPGVYWTTVQLRFIAPTSAANPNTLQLASSSLVMMAGAVGQMVDDRQGPRVTSPDVDITGLGIRNGWSVTLPNSGGQWANNFASPFLQIEAVGPSIAEVATTMQRLINLISADLLQLEQRSGVDPHNYVRTQLTPLTGPQFYYQVGSRIRAGLASVLLGLGLTLGAVTMTRAYGRRRIARRVANA